MISLSKLLEIENLAKEVQVCHLSDQSCPVDILYIAKEEGIKLAPDEYGDNFYGRIEYEQSSSEFILFYPVPSHKHHPNEIRFSVAHELGHYFIPEHRDDLTCGKNHNLVPVFLKRTKHTEKEREADKFAANLLLPKVFIESYLKKTKFDLSNILEISDTAQVSTISTAIRFVELSDEACGMFVCDKDKIFYFIASEEAKTMGFSWMGDKYIPDSSAAKKAATQVQTNIVQGEINSSAWFSERNNNNLIYEEAKLLGNSGIVLGMLYFS